MSSKKRKLENSASSSTPKRKCVWLTLEQKLQIIKRSESGETCAKIASEIGKKESSIRSILSKKEELKK